MRVDKRYGFINKEGGIVIEPLFDSVGDFTEGIAEVWIDVNDSGKMGYIDKLGIYIWEPEEYRTIYL